MLFQQSQGFRHADQHAVERPARHLAGGDECHCIKRLAVAHQVFLQALGCQKRVAAGRHLNLACQADRQSPEAVIEHQYAGDGAMLLFGQVAEQILVGGIESLQRVIVLLWLADQIELGEGTVKQGHGGGGSGSTMGGGGCGPPAELAV